MEILNALAILTFTIGLTAVFGSYCAPAQAGTEINSTAGETSNNIEFATYRDDDLGFVIQYPVNWTVFTNDLTGGDVVIFGPEHEENTDVRIKLITPYEGQTLGDLGDRYFKSNNGDYKPIAYYRNSSTTLSGFPAIKAIGILVPQDDTSSTSKVLTLVTFSKSRNSFVEILYGANKPNFPKNLQLIEKMLDTFRLFEPRKSIQEDN